MRRLALLGLLCVAAILSCGKDVTGPLSAAGRFVRGLSWEPIFPAAFQAAGGVGSGIVQFSRVHVVLHHSDGTVALDTTIDFPPGDDSLTVNLTVKLLDNAPANGEPMTLTLDYLTAAGDIVFKGGPVSITASPPPAGGGSNPPVHVPVSYTGPGANAVTVAISPRSGTVVAGAGFSFSAVAKDVNGVTLAGTPIIWNSLDPAIATITSAAAGNGLAQDQRGTARIIAQLLTGPADTVRLFVLLSASQIIAQSGNAQTGVVGTQLAQPLVVKVAATDGIGVAGVTVSFAVATGGGSVGNASAVSDANGLAQTTFKLGTGTGSQSVTATAGTLTNSPLTFTATVSFANANLIWTGATSNAWTTASNWNAARVPTANDSVYIPVGGTQPSVTTSISVKHLYVASGATITNTGTIIVGGNLDAGNTISGGGMVSLVGVNNTLKGTINGTVGVFNTYTIAGATAITGSLMVNPGRLTLDGNTVNVTGTFTTGGGGLLVMQNAADVLNVSGAASFGGGTETGLLTAGNLNVGGSFMQFVSASSFDASGTHTTTLNGATAQTLAMSAPLTSRFQNVTFANPAGTTLQSNFTALGNVHLLNGSVSGATVQVTIAGTLMDSLGGFQPAQGIIFNGGLTPVSALTSTINVPVSFNANPSILQANLMVNGAVIVQGNLQLNSHYLVVNGTFTTLANGQLTMTNAGDSAYVSGNATFGGGSEVGLLTRGALVVSSFTQSGPTATSFAADSTHKTYLLSLVPVGINFANPGTGAAASHFGTLIVETGNNIVLQSDVYVDGALVMATANPPFNIVTGPPATPRLLVSRGANVRQLMFNNVRWLLLDGSATTKLDTVTFNSMDPTVAQFEVQRNGTLPMPNLNNWTFATTPTSGLGLYARATDTDGLAPFLTLNFVQQNPTTNGGFIAALGGAIINWPAGALATITVSPNPSNLSISGTQTFTAVGKDVNGNLVGIVPVWSVVNPTAGSINSGTGLFTAGTVPGAYTNMVQATSGAISGFATVNVAVGPLASITVIPNPSNLSISGTQQFTAVGKDAGGNLLMIVPAWSVVNPTAGGINSGTGLFTAGTVPGAYTNMVQATSGAISGFATVIVAAPAPLVDFGTVAINGIMAGASVTCSGTGVIQATSGTANISISPSSTITGFPPCTFSGATHLGDAQALADQLILTAAYNTLAGQPCPAANNFGTLDQGGKTLPAGVYCSGSTINVTGPLTLDGRGDPNATFVFQAGSGLAATGNIVLINGAQAKNVYWQVGGSATLTGTNLNASAWQGNIVAFTSISLNVNSTLLGRALARNGSVTMTGVSVITLP